MRRNRKRSESRSRNRNHGRTRARAADPAEPAEPSRPWWSDLPEAPAGSEWLDDLSDSEVERELKKRERAEARAARRGRRRRPRELTAEERAYLEARRKANARMGFLFHLVPYAATCLFLLLVAGFRAFLSVAIFWGIGVVCHWFAVQAPELRRRWVEDEVNKKLTTSVHQERRVLKTEHNRSVEELTASIAHEIRNPITAAKSLVQQMGEDPRAGENIEYAKVALEELDRVEKSVSHLLKFAREEEVRVSDMTMSDVIEAALDTFQDRIVALDVEILKDLDSRGAMRGDPEKLRRVIINLFSNALDALEQSATVGPRVEIQAGENLAGTEVWVRIRDNGPGMEPEKVEKIFKPFYTSKANGTGLGLAITKKLVDAHGGSIEAVSQPGQGAEFVLTFPKAGPSEASASA
ncbi:MAG: HAMP domain-containing histidine kinase [Deltaproteobacteria bacterium]|nr:HAMP domain-containing histidine kinase [Deltaproteobacteria bacterium]